MKLKKINFLICLYLITTALIFMSCSSNNDSSVKVNDNVSSNNSKKENSNTKTFHTEDNNDKQVTENTASSNINQNVGGVNFTKKELESNINITFNTEWKDSEDKNYSACIEGKGSQALEEGIGKIIIKNGQKIYSYEIEDNTKMSPKYLEWADKKNLFIIVGLAHGTLAKGGDLYMLNVLTGKSLLLIKNPSEKEQIMSVEKDGNNINLKVNIYDDDVFNKSHVENWVIDSFNTDLNGKIEVKNADGKVVYDING